MTFCDRKAFHLFVSLFIAAVAGAVLGALVLDAVTIPSIVKWGMASTAGYLSVYVAEKTLKCGPTNS